MYVVVTMWQGPIYLPMGVATGTHENVKIKRGVCV